MTLTEQAIRLIDQQIEKLIEAKNLLRGAEALPLYGRQTKTAPKVVRQSEYTKRVISPEARKKIADAQKKRWAAKKKPKSGPPTVNNNKIASVEAEISAIKVQSSSDPAPKTFSAPSIAPKPGV